MQARAASAICCGGVAAGGGGVRHVNPAPWPVAAEAAGLASARGTACRLGWPPRRESNPHLALRRRSFYPLNYGGCAEGRILASEFAVGPCRGR